MYPTDIPLGGFRYLVGGFATNLASYLMLKANVERHVARYVTGKGYTHTTFPLLATEAAYLDEGLGEILRGTPTLFFSFFLKMFTVTLFLNMIRFWTSLTIKGDDIVQGSIGFPRVLP